MPATEYRTAGDVKISCRVTPIAVDGATEGLTAALDSHRGVLLTSTYEYPGRYTRWDIGFQDPPVEITSRGRSLAIHALNERGEILLPAIRDALRDADAVAGAAEYRRELRLEIVEPRGRFPEEQRSRQPSVFSILRAIIHHFASSKDPYLGLYGAFGYDLAFQFEPVELALQRPRSQRDLVLYLPDQIVVVDHQRERAELRSYDFDVGGRSTEGTSRETEACEYAGPRQPERTCDHEPGEYAALVELARGSFKRGDLFEAVPGQTFFEPATDPPSVLFRRLRARNPSPYGFLINLGEGEYLVGASPEMYVRVDGDRVETCPISGTIARGEDPIADAARVLTLLNSTKDEAELTMCTDVDRNDKSRICVPGSVRVIGRRQIEMYSRVIHTVDHVEGRLRPEFDALDAFLSHTWAVTVTGAPKAWAMQFLERHEHSPRAWYGGAVGVMGFDGNLNTGLTLRTIRIRDGVAEVRAGATLLFDSDPEEEERETRVKASALLDAIRRPEDGLAPSPDLGTPGAGKRILLVDHEDSFVHTLANYLRQTGAEVVTMRHGLSQDQMRDVGADLVVLSPGPGTPSDFDLAGTLGSAVALGLPVFGVCLGLQGMVEFFGGRLGTLDIPVHGKASRISVDGGSLFSGLSGPLTVGRYHSLYALPESLPQELTVTSRSEDGVVMAIEDIIVRMCVV
jgi:anthranilate synthase